MIPKTYAIAGLVAVFALVLAASTPNVIAQSEDEEKREEMKAKMEERRAEMEDKNDEKRADLEAKLSEMTEEEKEEYKEEMKAKYSEHRTNLKTKFDQLGQEKKTELEDRYQAMKENNQENWISPRQQTMIGVDIDEVICLDSFELVQKTSNGAAMCVKPSTAETLIERGFATIV